MNQFQQFIQSTTLKPVSWFKPSPTRKLEEPPEPEEFGVDNCLDCGFRTKLIFECNGRFLTCVRCGWIEPFENLNDVEFGEEVRAEIYNPDLESGHRTNGFSIVFRDWAGCSIGVDHPDFTSRKVNKEGVQCPSCKSGRVKGGGHFKNANSPHVQRYQCLNCKRRFSHVPPLWIATRGIKFAIKTRLPPSVVRPIINSAVDGNSIRHTIRSVGGSFGLVGSIYRQLATQTNLTCKCGVPYNKKHLCKHILINSPRRLFYLKEVSPKWRTPASLF